MDGWTKKKGGAAYAGVSQRTFHELLKKGLRHIRLPTGTILLKFAWIDEFLEGFEVYENRIGREVDEILKDFV